MEIYTISGTEDLDLLMEEVIAEGKFELLSYNESANDEGVYILEVLDVQGEEVNHYTFQIGYDLIDVAYGDFDVTPIHEYIKILFLDMEELEDMMLERMEGVLSDKEELADLKDNATRYLIDKVDELESIIEIQNEVITELEEELYCESEDGSLQFVQTEFKIGE